MTLLGSFDLKGTDSKLFNSSPWSFMSKHHHKIKETKKCSSGQWWDNLCWHVQASGLWKIVLIIPTNWFLSPFVSERRNKEISRNVKTTDGRQRRPSSRHNAVCEIRNKNPISKTSSHTHLVVQWVKKLERTFTRRQQTTLLIKTLIWTGPRLCKWMFKTRLFPSRLTAILIILPVVY